MSDFQRARHATILSTRADMAIDAGLRSFMIGVYNKVALGLLVSAALAYLTSSVPPVRDLMFVTSADGHLAGMTPIGWIVAIAPLGILLVSGFAMRNPTSGAASALYWTIVALIGASQGRSGAGHWVAGRYHPSVWRGARKHPRTGRAGAAASDGPGKLRRDRGRRSSASGARHAATSPQGSRSGPWRDPSRRSGWGSARRHRHGPSFERLSAYA